MSRGGDYWRRAREASNDPTWRTRAACRDMGPAIFFDDHSGEALEVCKRCPVRRQCSMTAAVGQEPYGVWGGKRRKEPTPRFDREQEGDEIAAAVGRLVAALARDAWSTPQHEERAA